MLRIIFLDHGLPFQKATNKIFCIANEQIWIRMIRLSNTWHWCRCFLSSTNCAKLHNGKNLTPIIFDWRDISLTCKKNCWKLLHFKLSPWFFTIKEFLFRKQFMKTFCVLCFWIYLNLIESAWLSNACQLLVTLSVLYRSCITTVWLCHCQTLAQ